MAQNRENADSPLDSWLMKLHILVLEALHSKDNKTIVMIKFKNNLISKEQNILKKQPVK